MTADELLDAHTLRMRTDPGYSAIWQRANSRLYPDMKLIVAMLAWAEQADGLRAMAITANAEPARRMVAIECPYCHTRTGYVFEEPKHVEILTADRKRAVELLAWCIGQLQGESGAGESYWEQFWEYEDARKIVEMSLRAGIITGGKKA